MTLYELFDELPKYADAQNKMAMERYMRNQFVFLGIKTPLRREISGIYLKEANKRAKAAGYARDSVDWDFVSMCWKRQEREFQMLAIDYLLALKECLAPEDIDYLQKLIISKSWWDSVDALAKLVGHICLKKESMQALMLDWSLSDNLWLRRTAIIHQLAYKKKTNQELLTRVIQNNLASQEFFINKAIGWALREYAKTNPDWVIRFLIEKQDVMSALSMREARKNLK